MYGRYMANALAVYSDDDLRDHRLSLLFGRLCDFLSRSLRAPWEQQKDYIVWRTWQPASLLGVPKGDKFVHRSARKLYTGYITCDETEL